MFRNIRPWAGRLNHTGIGLDGDESGRANGFQIDFVLNVFYMAKKNARKSDYDFS